MHQVIRATIHDVARGGSGVARLESGEIVFVPFTAPGDEVSIRILEKNKNYSQGELIEILKPSPERIEPPCPVFQKCGGCSWQHLPYELQFSTKKKGVLHALSRAQVITTEVPVDELPAHNPFFYRNRIQLRGNPHDQSFGFYERSSNRIVSISECKIARSEINAALPALKEEGMKLRREFKVEAEVSETGEIRTAWNRGHAAFGFRQINDEQNRALQQWVSDHAEKGDLLLDLFGGSGNLSLPLQDRFKNVICVDTFTPRQPPPTVNSNFRFERSDVLKWLDSAQAVNPCNVVSLLDPPREGLGSGFSKIESDLSAKFNPHTLILVGCDPDSFARDLSRFIKRGFQLHRLGVLDLFPQTPHVESLAVLKKNTIKS